MDVNSYKAKILSRYFEHYQRVDSLSDANVLKTSEDIMMELRPIVDLQINEISEWMVESDYVLDVEGGGVAVWLLWEPRPQSLAVYDDD